MAGLDSALHAVQGVEKCISHPPSRGERLWTRLLSRRYCSAAISRGTWGGKQTVCHAVCAVTKSVETTRYRIVANPTYAWNVSRPGHQDVFAWFANAGSDEAVISASRMGHFFRDYLFYVRPTLELAMEVINLCERVIRKLFGTESESRKAVESIGRHAGITIGVADNHGGMLLVLWKREEYHATVISLNDVTARIGVQSQIRFPARRLPHDVCRAVAEMNESMENCMYGEDHCATYSAFAVHTWMGVMDLSPGAFLHVFANLIEPVQTLDRLLFKYGFAR
jgi:hypothetical protein